jgi:hypothetical protein
MTHQHALLGITLATTTAIASIPTLTSDVSDTFLIVAPVLHFILLSFRKRGTRRLIFFAPIFGF